MWAFVIIKFMGVGHVLRCREGKSGVLRYGIDLGFYGLDYLEIAK